MKKTMQELIDEGTATGVQVKQIGHFATVKFLDYQIVNSGNGDGWVLQKVGKKAAHYECHLGNYSSIESAMVYAVRYFMAARPADFATQVVFRMTGSACSHDYFKFKEVVQREGLVLPDDFQPSAYSSVLMFRGREI
jgi:hypothetical protein